MGSGRADRPDVVPGVAELRKLGFEPVEEYTGALLVAEMWPDDHRRFVPETRQRWLGEEPELGGRLWLLRSPGLVGRCATRSLRCGDGSSARTASTTPTTCWEGWPTSSDGTRARPVSGVSKVTRSNSESHSAKAQGAA